jgi:protein O-GlcNAc transferase
LALGDVREAERSARAAIAADPSLPEAHLNLGNTLHAQEQWDGAIAAHREAIRLRPGFVPVLSSLGNALKASDHLH